MELSTLLADALLKRGVRQSVLASEVGVSQGYISALVSGRKVAPSASVLSRLAAALQIPTASLFAAAGLDGSRLPAAKAFVLGVCGASGSGKSWFADKVRELHPSTVTVISQDRYYKPRDEVALLPLGWDEPAALRLDALAADIQRLQAGAAVSLPTYDFKQHAPGPAELVQPSPVLVVEGHLIFQSAALMQMLDETLWIHADDYQLLRRRLLRDCKERGRTWDDVVEVFEQVVMPSNRLYVQPQRALAAMEFNNNAQDPDVMPLLAKALAAYAQKQTAA